MSAKPDRLVTGTVFNIQKYSVHDGPGIRTIVFIKGCTLACQWCSNPESQARQPEIAVNPGKCLTVEKCRRCMDVCENHALVVAESGVVLRNPQACRQCLACADHCPTHALSVYGYETTVDAALKRVEEDGIFYARSGGGLTLSGGEPLTQASFALALLREARRRRIHTCIETCGNVPWAVLDNAAPYLDGVFYDVKSLNDDIHRVFTGGGNGQILENLKRLSAEYPEIPVTVRTPVIPGFNDNEADIAAIADFVRSLGPHVQYELLAYHRMGTPKYAYLGRDYPMAGVENLPEEKIAPLRAVAEKHMARCEAAA
jgi:pyruvate formate lyase activating enzyme